MRQVSLIISFTHARRFERRAPDDDAGPSEDWSPTPTRRVARRCAHVLVAMCVYVCVRFIRRGRTSSPGVGVCQTFANAIANCERRCVWSSARSMAAAASKLSGKVHTRKPARTNAQLRALQRRDNLNTTNAARLNGSVCVCVCMVLMVMATDVRVFDCFVTLRSTTTSTSTTTYVRR